MNGWINGSMGLIDDVNDDEYNKYDKDKDNGHVVADDDDDDNMVMMMMM